MAFLFANSSFAYDMPRTDYKIIAASATNSALGGNSAAGDIIERLIIVPETTGAGTVAIRDGTGSAAAFNSNVFVTGTLSDLRSIVIDLGARSVSGDWSVTTGANVHVIAIGRFQ